jgi:hypothetical protein
MASTPVHNLSQRGYSNVEAIMPKIRVAVEQREILENTNIDLGTAENWLIRPELVEMCTALISNNLEMKARSVSHGERIFAKRYSTCLTHEDSLVIPICSQHMRNFSTNISVRTI